MGHPFAMELLQVRLDAPAAQPLLAGLAGEYATRYGDDDELRRAEPAEFEPPGGTFLVLVEDGETLAGGGIRRVDPKTCEVKRMWTAPRRRRQGLALQVLRALEHEAGRLGYTRVRLETGPRQEEAVGLYAKAGYGRVPTYGIYPEALAFEKALARPGPASFDGKAYQDRFDALAASGADVHGEAAFVTGLEPRRVLDVGCGTGRVAIELARRGVEVVGVDRDASMLAVARARGPGIGFVESDMTRLELGERFEVVLMAGNVPLFTPDGTEALLVARCAAHLTPGGRLVAGFQLGRGYALADYDRACAAAGLELEARFSTWERDPFVAGTGDYAVSVHRRDGIDGTAGALSRP